MKPLKILVTGSGAPGIAGTIYSLRNNFDKRKVKIIGTDCNPDAVGKYLCDKFYQISRADEPEYLSQMQSIITSEKIDVVMPQNTGELHLLSEFESDRILVSSNYTIDKANNKQSVIEEWDLVVNIKDLKYQLKNYGWPDKQVVIKPPTSNGMRGFRIIDESFNKKESFYKDKPDNIITNFEALKKILGKEFPELLVCEYLPGKEYSVDCLRIGSRIDVIPRERTQIRSGITFAGKVVKNKTIIKKCKEMAKDLDLQYCFGFQFKEDSKGMPRVLECNPRVQGTMVMSTLAGANVIWGAVKYALGEEVPEFDVDWDSTFHRYWGGIDNKEIKI